MKLIMTNVPFTSKIKVYQNNHLLEWFRGGDTQLGITHVDMTKPIRIEVESSLVKRLLYPILLPLFYLLFDYGEPIAAYHSVYRVIMMPQEVIKLRVSQKNMPLAIQENMVVYQNDCYLRTFDFFMCIVLFGIIDSIILFMCYLTLAYQVVPPVFAISIFSIIFLVMLWGQYQDIRRFYRLYQQRLIDIR